MRRWSAKMNSGFLLNNPLRQGEDKYQVSTHTHTHELKVRTPKLYMLSFREPKLIEHQKLR